MGKEKDLGQTVIKPFFITQNRSCTNINETVNG